MRGPGLRKLCDVRRTWECPRCGYQRRAPATETTVRCHCIKEQPLMRLVEGQRVTRPAPRPRDVYIEYDPSLPLEDQETDAASVPELSNPVTPEVSAATLADIPSEDSTVFTMPDQENRP